MDEVGHNVGVVGVGTERVQDLGEIQVLHSAPTQQTGGVGEIPGERLTLLDNESLGNVEPKGLRVPAQEILGFPEKVIKIENEAILSQVHE